MKKIFIPILAVTAFMAGCKKDANTTNPTTTNPTTTSPYYFKGTFKGQQINLSSNIPQYMSAYADNAGGYMINGNQLTVAPSLSLAFHFDHMVTNADMLALAGQDISFNPSASPHAEVNYEPILESTDSAEFYSVDTTASSYSVHVNSISFVRSDIALDSVDVYLINGTCNVMMNNYYEGNQPFTNGSFNFLVSRRKN